MSTRFSQRQSRMASEKASKEENRRRKEKELMCVFPEKEDIVGDVELELLMMNG